MIQPSELSGNVAEKQGSKEAVSALPVRQISVVIITQDEEVRTANAIRSCQPFADEVIVVDGGSKDSTVQRAQELGCKVYINPWLGYAKQRNFAASKTTHEWIFYIDSDEVVSEELASAIIEWKTMDKLEANAFTVNRVSNFMGEWIDSRAEFFPRLYNKNIFTIKDILVHEGIDEGKNCRLIKLSGVIWHYGFRSIDDHVRRINRYTSLEAEREFLKGRKFNLIRLVLKPPAKLIKVWLGEGTYRQGLAGFAVAFLWSFYTFLTEIKLYEIYCKEFRNPEEPEKTDTNEFR